MKGSDHFSRVFRDTNDQVGISHYFLDLQVEWLWLWVFIIFLKGLLFLLGWANVGRSLV